MLKYFLVFNHKKLRMVKDGFSIMTVMIGSIVVAALAITYMQKAKNKAEIAMITDIIAYRDYVFRYYSDVAANRMAWPCTLKANPGLQTYVSGGGGAAGPHNLWLYDIDGDGCVLTGATAGTGKEVITGSGAGTAQGLGLGLYDKLPPDTLETYDPDNPEHDIRVYAMWEGLSNNAVRIRLAASYNYENDAAMTSFKIKEKETYIYMGRTPARNCGESLSHYGFHDDYGSGATAPQRYFGDTAITYVNAETRLVNCWEQGPLVIPPCFDLLELDGGNLSFSTRCPSLGNNPKVNYAGMCPKELGLPKVPALAGFAANTGKTICERGFALYLGDRQSTDSAYRDYCKGDEVAVLGIKRDHRPECSPGDRFGTRGGRAAEGIAGFNTSGVVGAGTIDGKTGRTGKQGHPCVIRTKGEKGDNRECDCQEPSTITTGGGGGGSCTCSNCIKINKHRVTWPPNDHRTSCTLTHPNYISIAPGFVHKNSFMTYGKESWSCECDTSKICTEDLVGVTHHSVVAKSSCCGGSSYCKP